jgi:putative endonuclease
MVSAAVDWYFYMVRCRDSSLYSGITSDVEERVRKHNAGTGARYTSSHRPVALVYRERHDNVSAAMKRERQVKGWSRARKEQLINGSPAALTGQAGSPLFDALSGRDPAAKYSAAKTLLATARDHPSLLRPHLDFFMRLLDSDNSILKWTAIDVVGYLAGARSVRNVGALTERLVSLLNGGKLITANHAISALAAIAHARPRHRSRIVDELLRVEAYTYETGECRNIAIGKVILAFSHLGQPPDTSKVVDFVRRQTHNERNATRKKADAFLKKFGRE